jgi:hypothetical protein
MSVPSRRTFPWTRVSAMMSFIRFRQRRNVDLPHPDGPMKAVTDFEGISTEMSWRAWFCPYQKSSRRASIRTGVANPGAGAGSAAAGPGGGRAIPCVRGSPGVKAVGVMSCASFRAAV